MTELFEEGAIHDGINRGRANFASKVAPIGIHRPTTALVRPKSGPSPIEEGEAPDKVLAAAARLGIVADMTYRNLDGSVPKRSTAITKNDKPS